MKPNFKNIDIYAGFQPQNGMEYVVAEKIIFLLNLWRSAFTAFP